MPLIALDTMSGDKGPDVVVLAALNCLARHPDLSIILVGAKDCLTDLLASHQASNNPRLTIQHASDVISMTESPSVAIRNKTDSSMHVAIKLVKENTVGACVSAGNTGALMAISRSILKTFPGIYRPAICVTMPTISGKHTHMLDLGANINADAEQLLQFAVMGNELASALGNREQPSVTLLNIGTEILKGREEIRQAASLLTESDLNYNGFIEGTDIYAGKADVIVCDGFIGNIALKTSEGVTKLLKNHVKKEFKRNFYSKLVGVLAKPILNRISYRIDPRRYNGASLLGLKGIIIKSHGNADEVGFSSAISVALAEIENNIPERIMNQLETVLLS